MDVTTEMLQAAVRKAVEAGLLPRHARPEDGRIHQELIRFILEAALNAAPGANAGGMFRGKARHSSVRVHGANPEKPAANQKSYGCLAS